MEFIHILGGIILGGLIVTVIARVRDKARAAIHGSELKLLRQEKEKTEHESRQKDSELLEVNRQLAEKSADYRHLSQKFEAERAELEKIQEKFRDAFQNLANDILEEKSRKFSQQNRDKLDEILRPLKENIQKFEKKVEDTYDRESKERFALDREVKRLAELNRQISEDAHRLTRALKGESKTQGNWGEMILESILEKSGLRKDWEYSIQESVTTGEGKRLQPDVVVRLPGNRHVIIDSKVSLNAYERFFSAGDEQERELARRDHLTSVKAHVQELSSKDYQNTYSLHSLDFVMMFMPVEPAYMLAIQSDRELWNYAYDRKILLISPGNLLVSLKMIANLWRQEYQAKNVLEIARQSGDLLDKFYALLNDLAELGTRLKSVQTSYESTMNKLSQGRGNLIRRAQKIKELGARTKKTLPDQFPEDSD